MLHFLFAMDVPVKTVVEDSKSNQYLRTPSSVRWAYQARNNNLRTLDLKDMYGSTTFTTVSDGQNTKLFRSHATWQDIMLENFDVVSKLRVKKSYKVRARVASVQKYAPKTYID